MDKMEVMKPNEQEKELGREVTALELEASSLTILTDEDFEVAGNAVKKVKSAQKMVEGYWEPMRKSSYAAYKAVTDHKKEMMDPLKNAEKILKGKMSDYQAAKERARRAEEERLRALAEAERERKLAEAAKAEAEGDAFSAEYAMTEAEALDNMAATVHVAKKEVVVSGITQSKAWAIRNIDLSKLPVEFGGVVIRPADEKAIMALIKSSGGTVAIPGVEYEETVSFSVRAS